MKNSMNKVLAIIILSGVYLAGCSSNPPLQSLSSTASPNDPLLVKAWGAVGYVDVVVIDGCQYIASKSMHSSSVSFCHKGNCNNPIHYYVIEKNTNNIQNLQRN